MSRGKQSGERLVCIRHVKAKTIERIQHKEAAPKVKMGTHQFSSKRKWKKQQRKAA